MDKKGNGYKMKMDHLANPCEIFRIYIDIFGASEYYQTVTCEKAKLLPLTKLLPLIFLLTNPVLLNCTAKRVPDNPSPVSEYMELNADSVKHYSVKYY